MLTETATDTGLTAAEPTHPIIVLLVDDQPIVAHAVKEMLKPESDIRFHYCKEPLRAVEMANELRPTVILQDLVMPDVDGLTLLKFFRANSRTRQTPMIVLSSKEEATTKAQAFALGANDYLVKLPDRIELVARIRHHSLGYIARLQRDEAYEKLAESERRLADEVAQAAEYVRSLLPAPLKEGPVRIDWRFIPSTQLVGDSGSRISGACSGHPWPSKPLRIQGQGMHNPAFGGIHRNWPDKIQACARFAAFSARHIDRQWRLPQAPGRPETVPPSRRPPDRALQPSG